MPEMMCSRCWASISSRKWRPLSRWHGSGGADLQREIDTIWALDWPQLPKILEHDEHKTQFVVTLAKEGERLSTILGDNANLASMEYLYEYGKTLALLHKTEGEFPEVKDRAYFHIPPLDFLEKQDLQFVHPYLVEHQPKKINRCFCHGDFHYANILWKDKHISAILDLELSGMGNKEFDIAWALILRPGQRFLKTEAEKELFLEGYRSQGTVDLELLKYYMVQIYARFYSLGESGDGYQEYVRAQLHKICQNT